MCLTFHYSLQGIVILDVGYRLMITENDANPNASGIFHATMTIIVRPMTEYRFDVSGSANTKV